MRERGFFKMVLILVLAGACVLPNPTKAQTSTANGLPALTVMVRHAEKVRVTDEDVPLSSAGMARANALAAVLRNIKFSAILATDYMRTIQTAQPTAVALGLKPEIVPIRGDFEAHVEAVADAVRKHAGEAVLVVNHSNLLAPIIAALGGPLLYPKLICEYVYDYLFVLVPVGDRVELVRSHYGAPSPPPEPDCM